MIPHSYATRAVLERIDAPLLRELTGKSGTGTFSDAHVIPIIWLLMIGDFPSKGTSHSAPGTIQQWRVARHSGQASDETRSRAPGRAGIKIPPGFYKAQRKRRQAAALQKKSRLEAGATKYETSRLSPGTETLEGLARVAP